MAVPANFNVLNLTGKFEQNKKLSDDGELMLQHQGVGFVTRKAIGVASVFLEVKHYKDDDGVEHIDVAPTLTGGISGSKDKRKFVWEETEAEGTIFGPMITKTRRVKAEGLDEEYLTKGWTADTYEHGIIQAYTRSDTSKSGRTWTANATWGIEEVGGKRRYTRHIHFTGPDGVVLKNRLVYDYTGPV